jgi:hypothetical protein
MMYHGGPSPQSEPAMLESPQNLRTAPPGYGHQYPRADAEAHMLDSERERWEMEG